MKKIFNNMAHKATVIAAVLLAALNFSLVSCSDDDDDEDAPKAETILDKINNTVWFEYVEHENGEIEYYSSFEKYTKEYIYSGRIIFEEEVDYWKEYYELPLNTYDLLILYKTPINDFKIISDNTVEIYYGKYKYIYELSKDGKCLKSVWYENGKPEPIKNATLIDFDSYEQDFEAETGSKLGKIYDVSD